MKNTSVQGWMRTIVPSIRHVLSKLDPLVSPRDPTCVTTGNFLFHLYPFLVRNIFRYYIGLGENQTFCFHLRRANYMCYCLYCQIALPVRQSKALYKFGFFEGILEKAKFVTHIIC